jgi:hypothetical protein
VDVNRTGIILKVLRHAKPNVNQNGKAGHKYIKAEKRGQHYYYFTLSCNKQFSYS